MFYVIHTSGPDADPVIIGLYRTEHEAREFVAAYIADHGEEDCLEIARTI